jgi:hypothetical protein
MVEDWSCFERELLLLPDLVCGVPLVIDFLVV